MEKMRIKEWYCSKYPDDELGEELKDDTTFYDLFYCLDRGKDVYDCIVSDSLTRERVFCKLAEIMQCDYDYIYNQWLIS